jgi:hypothetical protein
LAAVLIGWSELVSETALVEKYLVEEFLEVMTLEEELLEVATLEEEWSRLPQLQDLEIH